LSWRVVPEMSLRSNLESLSRFSSQSSVIIFLAFVFTLLAANGNPGLAQGFRVESKEAPSVVEGGSFVSLQGRFSIALPKHHHSFGPLAVETSFGTAKGDTYGWNMKEGTFSTGYIDALEILEEPETSKQLFDGLRAGLAAWVGSKNGKLISERTIDRQEHPTLEHPTLELKFEFHDALVLRRFYVVSRRLYLVSFMLRTEQRPHEALAFKVLDSFTILTEDQANAALKQKAAEAEPSPLPQEPVLARVRSDAEDEGLRGKVKTVFTESEDLSGTWSVQGRKPNGKEYYNSLGNLTKREFYDYKGNLYEITVYGYLDVGRVSRSKRIEREYNPPPIVLAGPAGPTPKPDPRYSNKFTFQYDEAKRLTEKSWFMNNGELQIRYVYKYSGNHREELVYSADGSLNQRYLAILDGKGNETEQTSFETRGGAIRDKYSYTYEFDAQGNWVKQTTSKWMTKDGKSQYVPAYINYRTIVYY